MNSKAKAEGRKCSGYLCYETERPAACMTLCLPNTLVKARAGMRAWEVAEWRAQSMLSMFINQSEILCPVAVFPSHCVYPSAQNETCCVLVEKDPSISFEVSFGRSEIKNAFGIRPKKNVGAFSVEPIKNPVKLKNLWFQVITQPK